MNSTGNWSILSLKMKIKLSGSFREKLINQVQYISKDKPDAARRFKNNLLAELKSISNAPYSYRRSIFFNNDEIKDLIFKGYVITFRIKASEELIEVFGFHKYQDTFP